MEFRIQLCRVLTMEFQLCRALSLEFRIQLCLALTLEFRSQLPVHAPGRAARAVHLVPNAQRALCGRPATRGLKILSTIDYKLCADAK